MSCLTTLDQWQEWRQLCALARCQPTTRAALQYFAHHRFLYYGGHVLGARGIAETAPDAAACWHLFETHLVVARPKSGRRYKEWLFARLAGSHDHPVDIIQGGASLIVRSAVAAWMRAEQRRPRTISLQTPLRETTGLMLIDLLPAVTEPPPYAKSETEEAVQQLLPHYRSSLKPAERVVILAKRLKLTLYHPAILQLCGVGRSQASNIWRNSFKRLAALVRQHYPGDSGKWQMRVALTLFQHISDEIYFRGRVEKRLQQLFKMAEARAVGRQRNHRQESCHE